jgi:predicted transcriptional regulator of viral defense system
MREADLRRGAVQRHRKDSTMPSPANSATLNVQPRQRRAVYESLAAGGGSSVKDLLGTLEIPETELRETLRKLEAAGLVQRVRGMWQAIPLDTGESGSAAGDDAAADAPSPD